MRPDGPLDRTRTARRSVPLRPIAREAIGAGLWRLALVKRRHGVKSVEGFDSVVIRDHERMLLRPL